MHAFSIRLGAKSIESARAEARAVLQIADGVLQEAVAMREAQAKLVDEGLREFEAAKGEVEVAIADEIKSAARLRAANERKAEVRKQLDLKRVELREAHTKIALAEVLALNQTLRKDLEAKRQQAAEAAKDATRKVRLLQKEQLDATRKVLAESRAISGKRAAAELITDEGAAEPKETTPMKALAANADTVASPAQKRVHQDMSAVPPCSLDATQAVADIE